MADLAQLAEHLQGALGTAIAESKIAYGELTIRVEAADLIRTLTFLRDDRVCEFKVIVDVCGADYPNRARRFDVVWHLLSVSKNQRIRVKVETDENTPVPSSVPVYAGAEWYERETYDMYGIVFSGHPDLRRLLTDYGFEGFPLRKDFPLTGYVEVRYDDEQKKVVYEPVKLVQEYRDFDFLSPWEGAPEILEKVAMEPQVPSGDPGKKQANGE